MAGALVTRKFRYGLSSLLVMYILTYTYAMSVPTKETVLARIIRKTSLFIGHAILRGPPTNDGTTPPVFQETPKNRLVQNDTSIRLSDNTVRFFVTTPSDKHTINSAESRKHNISSGSKLNFGIENPEGNTSSTDSAHNFLSKMSKFNSNSQQTMVVDLSTNTSPDTILIIDASAKVRIVNSCNENGRVYLQGDVVDIGQIGDCCYVWYCDSQSNIVYHEIPCLDHALHPAENLQMCVWKGMYYKPGEDILIEHQNGLCHGIHCTCDSHVIELYGSPCNIINPIADIKLNTNNTVLVIGTE